MSLSWGPAGAKSSAQTTVPRSKHPVDTFGHLRPHMGLWGTVAKLKESSDRTVFSSFSICLHQALWLPPEAAHRALSPALSALLSGQLESPLKLLSASCTRISSGPVKKCVGNIEEHVLSIRFYLLCI